LPKVVTQRYLEQDLNPRLTDRKPKCLARCTTVPPQYGITLPKFAIALPWLLLRSILRHVISLVLSLSGTTPSSPLTTAHASDLAPVVDCMCVIIAGILY